MYSFLIACLALAVAVAAAVITGEDSASSRPPKGHLKPLGSDATRLPVQSLNYLPTPSDFFQSYVYPSIPVVFRRGATKSPAFEKWTDEYFRSLPEAQDLIYVEMKKIEDRINMRDMRMPFVEFLDRYEVHDEYLVTSVPLYLKQDVLIPAPLNCDNIIANFVDTIIWFSSGGTKSVVHHDAVDNINCLIRGQKQFLFINYTQYKKQIVFDHPEGSYSSVNVEQVDLTKYPEFKDVEFHEAQLEAGDCVYIPYKWIHQVNSIGSNIAVNIWWNHQAHILPTRKSCGPRNDPTLSLADVDFYVHDVETNVKYYNPKIKLFVDNPLGSLTHVMEDEGKTSFTREAFLQLVAKQLSSFRSAISWTDEALNLADEIFKILDVNDDDLVALDDLESLSPGDYDTFSRNLGQKFTWLDDVADEQNTKQKQEQLRRLLQSETLEKNSSTREEL